MANWNLSVDLRGNGTSLTRSLRSAATQARSLDHAVTSARAGLRELDNAARGARGGLTSMGRAARTAAAQANRVGDHGVAGMRRFASETGRAHGQLRNLAALLSGGALVMGVGELVKEGNEYQQQMNSFGAVTGATQMQMKRAAATANQLGNDLSLPGATAGDAAEAMVELAKAGFRTDQAISATGASLRLASAAQVNAADSAKYLGDIMDQFGLGADQASKAADTLASTANAASGDIQDIYYAMKYAGPVAHGLGVSIEETAAAVGMLGKAGILGQTAGTTLRGMMANLAAPTPQMIDGLKAMNIQAWDAQGNFKGLRYVIDGLSKAQHNMTQQDFAAAVKKSMGKPAMSGAIAMAHQGVESFDSLMAAVKQSGSAADIAAAKGKGLAGAMLGLKTQAKQTGLAIYQGMSPGLEFLTRGITRGLSNATPKIEAFFRYFNDAATLFGPDIASAARDQFTGIAKASKDMVAPFKDLGGKALTDFLHILLSLGQSAISILTDIAHGVEPVISALGGLANGSSGAATALDIVVAAVDAASSVIAALHGVLVPIGHVVGGLVSAFGALPGPVQTAVAAMLLTRRIGPMFNNLAGTVRGSVTGAFQGLSRQMAVSRNVAAAAGNSMSRFGAAFSVLQARVPVIGQMAGSFRTAAAAGSGFTGTLRGITAAAGTGLKSAMSGLMGAMGGPWGLAIAGVTTALGFYAESQQKAAEATAEHEQRISNLTQALSESNGQITQNVRAQAAKQLQDMKLADDQGRLVDVMRQSGVSLAELTSSYLGQGRSLSSLRTQLEGLAKAHTKVYDTGHGTITEIDDTGKSAKAAADALGSMKGEMSKSLQNQKELAAAGEKTSGSVSAYQKLKDAVGALADKTGDADSRTRALRASLDLLSGGSISLQAAEARVNQAITQANEAMAQGVNKADGWGKALVKANGSIDTTSKNGQSLFNTLNDIADGSSNAAIAAYDFAKSQGKGLPERLKAAQAEMQKGRDAAVKLAGGYNIGAQDAAKLADSMGLIPGQVSILLQTEGVDSTLAELLAVQAEFAKVPKSKTVRVDTLSDEAKKKLEGLGYAVKLIPGTREYKVTAKTEQAKADLANLLKQMQAVPGGKSINMSAKTAGALRDLENLKAAVQKQHGKTITMNVPTAEGRRQLELLGFKIQSTHGKSVTVAVPTGGPRASVASIQAAINSLQGKTVTNTIRTNYVAINQPRASVNGVPLMKRDGGPIKGYASGGDVQMYPEGGYVRGPGTPTSDSILALLPAGPAMLSDTEFVVRAAAVRKYGLPLLDAINKGLLPKFANGGAIPHLAGGGADGFSYTPTGTMKSASDVQSAYSDAHQPISKDDYNKALRARANAVDTLRSAEARLNQVRRHRHTHAQLVSAEYAVSKARRSLATATDKARSAEARYKKTFSLSDWGRTLSSAVRSNAAYESNLKKIASRGGADVIDQLRDMGAEGASMVSALAKASKSQFNSIVANLRRLAPLAKATLSDYTAQLNASNKTSSAFQTNLARLAAMGYGDLATQLAGQGDDAAQKIAAEAVKSKTNAAKANSAAKTSAKTLSGEELGQLVQIIAAVKSSKTGIHDVAAATGLGEEDIVAVAAKASSQIKSSLGSRSARFLADLARAQKGLSYANGGIRAGLYATRGGAVTFAEPSTGGEAYIPLGGNKRASATNVLSDVAGRFGLGLTDARASRVVVISQEGPTTVNVPVTKTNASAYDIGHQVGRQMRRARRGGVAARAGR